MAMDFLAPEKLTSSFRLHCVRELQNQVDGMSFEKARAVEQHIFDVSFHQNLNYFVTEEPKFAYKEMLIDATHRLLQNPHLVNGSVLYMLYDGSYEPQDTAAEPQDEEEMEKEETQTEDDGLIMCQRCNSSLYVSFYTRQTRSADEAATVFVSCSKCRSKWRQ